MGRLPFLTSVSWAVDLSTPEERVVRLPQTFYTRGVSMTPGATAYPASASVLGTVGPMKRDVGWTNEVLGKMPAQPASPEYVAFSNEAGGPKYEAPYAPKAPAYEPVAAAAGVIAEPAARIRRRAPFARERNAYNRVTGAVKRYALNDARRARAKAGQLAREVREDARKYVGKFKEAQKAEAKRLAKQHALQYAKRVGAKWATGKAKAAAWAYAKMRAKGAAVKQGAKQFWRHRQDIARGAARVGARIARPIYRAEGALARRVGGFISRRV